MSFKSSLYLLRAQIAIPSQLRLFREAVSHNRMMPEELMRMKFEKRLAILRCADENSPYYE